MLKNILKKLILINITALILVGGVHLFWERLLPNESSIGSVQAVKPNIGDRIDEYLKEYEAKGWFSGSVLVAEDDGILLNKGYGMADYERGVSNTPKTRFHLGSITKQFTAMAIMQLAEEGRLSTEDTLSKYIPDYPNGKTITIHQLLTHTSGIPDYINDDPSFSEICRLYHTTDEIIDRFKNKPLEFKPGTRYDYSNSGYVLLGYIIEKVSGKSYEEYLSDNIFKPLGMNNTGYDNLKPLIKDRACGYSISEGKLTNAEFFDRSNLKGADGLYSTVEDLYIWDQALYTEAIAQKQTLDSIFKAYPPANNYGYGWTINGGEVHHFGRMDGFYTCISRDTVEKTTIIILSNIQQAPIANIYSDIRSMMNGKNCKAPEELEKIIIDPR